jgi:hypothetical protein
VIVHREFRGGIAHLEHSGPPESELENSQHRFGLVICDL